MFWQSLDSRFANHVCGINSALLAPMVAAKFMPLGYAVILDAGTYGTTVIIRGPHNPDLVSAIISECGGELYNCTFEILGETISLDEFWKRMMEDGQGDS